MRDIYTYPQVEREEGRGGGRVDGGSGNTKRGRHGCLIDVAARRGAKP